jgi:hypothetical protein
MPFKRFRRKAFIVSHSKKILKTALFFNSPPLVLVELGDDALGLHSTTPTTLLERVKYN